MGKKPTKIEQAGEDLFNYAIDREDVKWLMTNLADVYVGWVKEYLEAIKLR
jgi:hypothetical protein